jgi:hypothetical protein
MWPFAGWLLEASLEQVGQRSLTGPPRGVHSDRKWRRRDVRYQKLKRARNLVELKDIVTCFGYRLITQQPKAVSAVTVTVGSTTITLCLPATVLPLAHSASRRLVSASVAVG